MRRKGKQILAAATAAALLLSGCGGGAGESKEGTSEQTAASGDKMTDVGTPRKDTLIVDMLSGTQTDPDNFNPYMTGCVAMDCGLHQLLYPCLWEADTMNGEQT